MPTANEHIGNTDPQDRRYSELMEYEKVKAQIYPDPALFFDSLKPEQIVFLMGVMTVDSAQPQAYLTFHHFSEDLLARFTTMYPQSTKDPAFATDSEKCFNEYFRVIEGQQGGENDPTITR